MVAVATIFHENRYYLLQAQYVRRSIDHVGEAIDTLTHNFITTRIVLNVLSLEITEHMDQFSGYQLAIHGVRYNFEQFGKHKQWRNQRVDIAQHEQIKIRTICFLGQEITNVIVEQKECFSQIANGNHGCRQDQFNGIVCHIHLTRFVIDNNESKPSVALGSDHVDNGVVLQEMAA